MSSQEFNDHTDSEYKNCQIPAVAVSNSENGILNYSTLTSSPIVSIASWPEMTGQLRLWLHCECTLADGHSGVIKLAEFARVNHQTGKPAFTCDLPITELAKLADQSRITLVLMVSTDGTREKQSLFSSRTSLIFQKPATLTNNIRWMTDIGTDLESLKINELIIPETHNSGVDQQGAGWPIDQWWACQDDTFTHQLNAGARALDLRLLQIGGRYMFHHSGEHSNRHLNNCVESVLRFVQQNPGEFVILDFHETADLDDFNKRIAASDIEDVLGAYCIPPEASPLTIAQIRNKWPGRNLIIAWDFEYGLHWPKVQQTWTGSDTNDPSDLEHHITSTFKKPPTNKLWSMFAAAYDWLGPMRLGPNSPPWKNFFDSISSDRYRVPSRGNMINVDFIAGTGVVEKCINATRTRANQASLSRPRALMTSNVTTNSIHLRWQPPLDGESVQGYVLYKDEQYYGTIYNSTEFTFNGLQDGVTHRLRVYAQFTSGIGSTAEIAVRTVGIPDVTKPQPPTNLKFLIIDGIDATVLSWTAATDNIGVIGYQLLCNESPTGGIIQRTSVSFYSTPGAFYKVRAFDAAGNFSDSDSLVMPVDKTPPSQPLHLQPLARTSNSIELSWAESTDNIAVTGYRIYRNNIMIDTVTRNYFIDRNLSEAATYIYSVSALDAAQNESKRSDSVPISTRDITPPSKPTNLTIHTGGGHSFLRCDKSFDNVKVEKYQLYRNNLFVDESSNELFLSKLDLSEPYWFRVRALDADGNYSDSDLLASADNQPPSRPGNLRPSIINDTSVTLDWDSATDNIAVTGYQVFRNHVSIATVDNTRYTVSGLEPGSYNQFMVSAQDPAGNLSYSESLTVYTTTPDTTPPSKPTNFRATSVTDTSVALSWDVASDNVGITGYQIIQDYAPLTTVQNTNYTVTGLTMGTDYIFKVRAIDAAGNGTDSDTLSVTPIKPPDTTAPSKPTNLRATAVTQNSADLAWNAASDNVGVTGYEIYIGNTWIITVTGTTHTVKGLAEGATYLFKVRAKDAAGNGTDSDTLAVAPTKPSNGPTNLEFNRMSGTMGAIQWEPPIDSVGVTGYKLSQDGFQIANGPDTGRILSNLTPGIKHLFEVRAIRSGQYSDPVFIAG